ncbi:acyl-CoA dehydrogenase C-terminal domain-containing protein [Achromobacter insolitus]|uniref:acyl-CoA dehydrogenase C-terminal domain-containing protein n=1 Tax=Achromobacter insolitus TaxID=217204 RepID=UPI0034640AC9
MDEVTEYVVRSCDAEPAAVAACSVPYLELFGIVAGGWQLARSALISARHMSCALEKAAIFHSTEVIVQSLYCAHSRPRAIP